MKLQGLLVVIFFVVSPILAFFNGGFDDDEYENDYEYRDKYSEEEIQRMTDGVQLPVKSDSVRLDSIK